MFYTIVYFIPYLLYESRAGIKELPDESALIRYSISNCIINTLLNETDIDDILTVSLSTTDYRFFTNSVVVTDQILLHDLYEKHRWSVFINRSDNTTNNQIVMNFYKFSDVYIIQIRTEYEFDSMLKSLYQLNSWNPHARFIIITTTIFTKRRRIVENIFAQLWRVKVLNAVILLPQIVNNTVLDIYSWFPYHNGDCGDKFNKACIVNTCLMGRMSNTEKSLFPEKIPNNMNGCPVRVRAVIWPPYVISPANFVHLEGESVNFTKGIEIMLMDTIAQLANFHAIYSVSSKKQNWGNITLNGTATGMLKAVLNEEVDIGLGAVSILATQYTFFDSSASYIWESVTWCVPYACQIPKWKSLFYIFHPITWITILFTLILVAISIWTLSLRQMNESTSYRNPMSCFQNLVSVLLGLAVKVMPRSIKIRMVVILWIIASLHLNAAFTSSLIRELTQPSYEKLVTNIQELIDKGFEVGLVPPTTRFLVNDHRIRELKNESFTFCTDVHECLERTAFNRDFVVGIPRMYIQYVSNKYLTRKGQQLVHWMKDDIASYPVIMIMTKGFPLRKRINTFIFKMVEAGLIAKWQDDFLYDNDDYDTVSVNNFDDSDSDADTTISLTVSHLEGAFIILSIGIAIAIIVFVGELIIFYRKYNSKHIQCILKEC